jgi:hypothetical protein
MKPGEQRHLLQIQSSPDVEKEHTNYLSWTITLCEPCAVKNKPKTVSVLKKSRKIEQVKLQKK